MFAVGFEVDIIKRRGRWVSATSHQYLRRDEHILANISRGMMSRNQNHGRADRRAGGKRKKPSSDSQQRLVAISKCTSGALRHRQPPGLEAEGWASMRTALNLKGMVSLKATFGDVQEIVDGGCGSRRRRFEMGRDRRTIRCARFHSVGSGVRPGCLPSATDLNYMAHGAILEAGKQITREGLSRRRRMRIHFYDCGRKFGALGGNVVRFGSDVAIVATSRQFVADGIVFYLTSNNVAMSEGLDGVIAPQYFRRIQRLRRDTSR